MRIQSSRCRVFWLSSLSPSHSSRLPVFIKIELVVLMKIIFMKWASVVMTLPGLDLLVKSLPSHHVRPTRPGAGWPGVCMGALHCPWQRQRRVSLVTILKKDTNTQKAGKRWSRSSVRSCAWSSKTWDGAVSGMTIRGHGPILSKICQQIMW
jgi:hypothetical protein